MKCQTMFSGKNKKKKNTILLSAGFALRAVQVKVPSKVVADDSLNSQRK